MEAQTFIIEQLRPYFLYPDTCGVDKDGICQNITPEGKMCVFGKNLIDPKPMTPIAAAIDNPQLLKPESRGILDGAAWIQMQAVHDTLSRTHRKMPGFGRLILIDTIKQLEKVSGTNLEELKDLANKLFSPAQLQ